MNLNRAIKLLDAVSDFQFKPSDKRPTVSIYYEQKDDYALYIRKGEVSQSYRKHLEEIVKSNSLQMRESNEHLKIHDH